MGRNFAYVLVAPSWKFSAFPASAASALDSSISIVVSSWDTEGEACRSFVCYMCHMYFMYFSCRGEVVHASPVEEPSAVEEPFGDESHAFEDPGDEFSAK